MAQLHVSCRMCGEEHILTVTEEQFHNWQRGMKVQDAFPNMPAADRELLISRTCSKCWDKLFPEDEEDNFII